MVGIKIRVLVGAGEAMMKMVGRFEFVVRKPGVEEEAEASHGVIEARLLGDERAVHAIVGDDEEAHREPNLQEAVRNAAGPLGRDVEKEDEKEEVDEISAKDQRGEQQADAPLARDNFGTGKRRGERHELISLGVWRAQMLQSLGCRMSLVPQWGCNSNCPDLEQGRGATRERKRVNRKLWRACLLKLVEERMQKSSFSIAAVLLSSMLLAACPTEAPAAAKPAPANPAPTKTTAKATPTPQPAPAKKVEQKRLPEAGPPPTSGTAMKVADVFAKKDTIGKEAVKLEGKVVKFNPNIMGSNWLHVQDGSGAEGTNDIVVTTKSTVAVGDQVEVIGLVSRARDFGAGYKFDVIIENARVTKK